MLSSAQACGSMNFCSIDIFHFFLQMKLILSMFGTNWGIEITHLKPVQETEPEYQISFHLVKY